MNNKNAPLKVMHTIDMKHCFLLSEFKKDEEEHIPKLLSLKKTLMVRNSMISLKILFLMMKNTMKKIFHSYLNISMMCLEMMKKI